MNEDDKLKPAPDRNAERAVRPDEAHAAPAIPPAASGAPAGAAAPADVQAYIGRQLRAVFDDVAKQPVPQRFLDLMRQLEDRTADR
jgi:hypothetical protein